MKSRVLTMALVAAGAMAAGLGGGAATAAYAEVTDPGATASPEATTWALQPATEEGPDDRVSLRHVIAGGDEATDMVAVTNFGDRPATFAIYAADGAVAADGNFDLIPSDQESVGGGAWVTIQDVEDSVARDGGGIIIDVPADSTAVVPVEIRVPDNATPGDHPAGIVAELVSGSGGGVQLASRVGVRLHLRVAGDIVAELVPEGITTAYRPSWNPFSRGTLTIDYTVANSGNVRLGSESVGSAAGPWGTASAQAEVSVREVLPGEAVAATIEIPVAPLFRTWGDITATPLVVGEDDVEVALTPSTVEFKVWTIPWSQLVLMLVLVGAFFAVRALRRRNAARMQARIAAAVAAAREPGSEPHGDEPTLSAGQGRG
ncbi:MAG: hypothetical protein ACK4MD_03385 [Demequina sp.]